MKENKSEMEQFIDTVYHEPYSVLQNNCFHKSIKIVRKARELGKDADLIICWTITPHRILGGFRTIQPHMYAEVEGKTVDVAFDPLSEEKNCKNNEQIVMFPIKLPKLSFGDN